MKLSDCKCLILLLVALLIPSLLRSQAPTGGIRGVIHDESGAVIPGVSITATYKTLGISRSALSDDTGTYLLPNLNVGEWEVKSELTSFQTQVQTVTVVTGSTVNVDFRLTVGASSEVVEVTSQVGQVNTTEYKIDGVVDRGRIQNLPLNGRSFMSLALLEPGVAAEYQPNPQWQGNSSFRVAVGGADQSTTRITVDGASIVDRLSGGTTQNFSQESVEEFQISTFNFDLSTGTAGSGAVNIVSRSGSNAFHGGGFIFYRDQNMAAFPALRRPCDPRLAAGNRAVCGGGDPELRRRLEHPAFVRRQEGFSLGGPLIKDKTFFFSNFEYINQISANSISFTDPIFQGFNHVAQAPALGKLFNIRFDHKINAKHSAFLRLSLDDNNNVQPGTTFSGVNIESNWATGSNFATQAALGINSVLSPRLVNDFRFSDSFYNEALSPFGPTNCNDPRFCFNLGGPTITGFGMVLGVATNVAQHRLQRTYQTSDNVFWNRGNHSVRFGFLWEHLNLDGWWERQARGAFTLFSPSQVQQQNPALYAALPATLRTTTAGVPTFADMMQLPVNGALTVGVGDPNWWSFIRNPESRASNAWRFYIQDSWRMRPDFTFSYGVAYSFETNFWNHYLDKPEFLRPVLGANARGFVGRDWNDVAPAVGLSWSPGGNQKTVIRAGSGIYYSQSNWIWRKTNEINLLGPQGNGWAVLQTTNLPNPLFGQPGQPAVLNATSPSALSGQNFLDLLPDIKAQLLAQWGTKADALRRGLSGPRGVDFLHQATGGSIFSNNRWATPYTIHATGGVQREIVRNLVVSADFVMRRGLKSGVAESPTYDWDANGFLRPKVTAVNPTTGVVSFVRDPVIPECTGNQRNIVGFPCSTGRILVAIPGQKSRYTALQLKVDGRFSGGFQFQGSYALSRFVSSNVPSVGGNVGFYQDDREKTYGINPADRKHRFTFNASYELPGLKGGNHWLRGAANGWTISSITEIVSAPPMNVLVASTGVDLDGDGLSALILPGQKFNEFGRGLDANRIRQLVAQYNATYPTLPDANGVFPTFRKRTPQNQIIPVITLPDKFDSGDSFFSTDIRLTKAIRIREGIAINLAVEGFNIFNVANLTGYSAELNQPNFGQPTDRINQVFGTGGPRAFQISARLKF
jgi:hypothetical protein